MSEPTGTVYGDCHCATCSPLRTKHRLMDYTSNPYVFTVDGDDITAKLDPVAVREHKAQVRQSGRPDKDATLTPGGVEVLRSLFWRGPLPTNALPPEIAEVEAVGWAGCFRGWWSLSENGMAAALNRGYGMQKERTSAG
jgi:hypothetical protein